MGFGEAIQTVLGKYVDFSGRARRSEYWYWTLAMVIAGIIIEILLAISHPLGVVVDIIWILATLLPGLAVFVRRMHDTGRTGWWWFMVLIPIVGWIVLLVFACQDSEPGDNKYGPSPKPAAAMPAYPAQP